MQEGGASPLTIHMRRRITYVSMQNARKPDSTAFAIVRPMTFLIKLDQRDNQMLVQMFIMLMFQTCAQYSQFSPELGNWHVIMV